MLNKVLDFHESNKVWSTVMSDDLVNKGWAQRAIPCLTNKSIIQVRWPAALLKTMGANRLAAMTEAGKLIKDAR
ncbi:MAG: hypothetical protein ACI9SK_001395 [Zhongshania sp.]|jgi:hypothetical protein